MEFSCGWAISGVVVERRELKSEKNATWRGYVVKVATLGMTAEVTVTPELFSQIADGSAVSFKGRFEDNKGYLRLVATDLVTPTSKGRAA